MGASTPIWRGRGAMLLRPALRLKGAVEAVAGRVYCGAILAQGLVMSDIAPLRRALISVSDKTGLIEFGRVLAGQGVEICAANPQEPAAWDVHARFHRLHREQRR